MRTLADISMLETLQSHANMQMGWIDYPIENATFWRNEEEIKVDDLDDTHPDKQTLQRINEIEANIGVLMVGAFFSSKDQNSGIKLDKVIEQMERENNIQKQLGEKLDDFKEEANELYQDRAIKTKAESEWLRQQLPF